MKSFFKKDVTKQPLNEKAEGIKNNNDVQNEQDYFDESRDLVVEGAGSFSEAKKRQKALIAASKGLEKSIIEVKDSKIKFLKGLVGLLFASTLLLSMALMFLAPLKTSVPYLLRVDRTTGFVDRVEPYNVQQNSVDEAVVRYFIAKFIENREGYDWLLVQDMYDSVQATSSPNVFNDYKNLYLDKEYSPINKLGKNVSMDVVVNSITFLSDNTAQIRYTKNISDKNGGRSSDTYWLATVAFDFSKKVSTEKQRLVNPLGFSVNAYKVDREIENAK